MKTTSKPNLRKAVAYMRYSSDNQTNIIYGHDEANTIETQRAVINECAALHGYEIVHEYIDAAYSGTTDNRPGFQQMIKDAQNYPEWKYIIIYKQDRFSRKTLDAIKYESMLTDNGISIKYTDNYVENESSNTELIKTIKYAMADEYSQNLSTNTYNGMKNKSESATHCGGKPPLGYDVSETEKLCINEHEAKVVKLIFSMYLSGESYSAMAKYLNSKGYTTKTGGPFTKNSFVSILTQVKYTGVYTWNVRAKKQSTGKRNNSAKKPLEEQTIIKNGCPVIISVEIFEKVQEEMKQRRQTHTGAGGKSRRNYMLTGLKILKCSECGAYMIGIADKTHGKEHIRYRCPNHKAGTCSTKDIRADTLNEFVAQRIVAKLLPKNGLSRANNLLSKVDTNRELNNRRKTLSKAVERLANSLERCTSDTILVRLNHREAELKEIDAKLAQSKPLMIHEEKEYKVVKSRIVKMLTDSADYDTRCLIRNVLEEVNVSNDTVEVKLKM